MPCSICKGNGKWGKNGNHKTHNRSTCTKKQIDFIQEVIPLFSVANIVNDYLFAPYPSIPNKLKTDIRIEGLKQKYSKEGLFDLVLDSITYWDLRELENCKCCHRHHPNCKIVPNRWRKKYTFEGKKCSCPCRHIVREWEEINYESEDDWEY